MAELALKVPTKSGLCRVERVILEPLRGAANTGVSEIALAAIHCIGFCISKAAIGFSGHAHDIGPLVDQPYCPSKPARAIQSLARPLWAQRSRWLGEPVHRAATKSDIS